MRGSVCNAFLNAIGLLDEWGPVDESLRGDYADNNGPSLGKRSGILFFILLTESQVFHDVTEKSTDDGRLPDAQEVIYRFQENGEPSVREAVTVNWLSRYRLDKALDEYRQDNGPGDEPLMSVDDEEASVVPSPDDEPLMGANDEDGGVISSPIIVAVHGQAKISDQTTDLLIEFDETRLPSR